MGVVFSHVPKTKLMDLKVQRSARELDDAKAAHDRQRADAKATHDELASRLAACTAERAELLQSWADVRQMYETGKRVKASRDKALCRKVVQRLAHRVAVACLQEWRAYTRQRKRQDYLCGFQAKTEQLEYDNEQLIKSIEAASTQLRFGQGTAMQAQLHAFVSKLGYRSVGVWWHMWKAFVREQARTASARRVSLCICLCLCLCFCLCLCPVPWPVAWLCALALCRIRCVSYTAVQASLSLSLSLY